jgi:hypothetical protein
LYLYGVPPNLSKFGPGPSGLVFVHSLIIGILPSVFSSIKSGSQNPSLAKNVYVTALDLPLLVIL